MFFSNFRNKIVINNILLYQNKITNTYKNINYSKILNKYKYNDRIYLIKKYINIDIFIKTNKLPLIGATESHKYPTHYIHNNKDN